MSAHVRSMLRFVPSDAAFELRFAASTIINCEQNGTTLCLLSNLHLPLVLLLRLLLPQDAPKFDAQNKQRVFIHVCICIYTRALFVSRVARVYIIYVRV